VTDMIARANARHALEMIRAGKMSLAKAEMTMLAILQSGIDLEELIGEIYGKSWLARQYADEEEEGYGTSWSPNPYEDDAW
jgi:hypothetical protein